MRTAFFTAGLTIFAMLFSSAQGRSAGPFDGVDWRDVVVHDPLLTRDPTLTGTGGMPFLDVADSSCVGAFAGRQEVVVGEAFTDMSGAAKTWVAAVPLDMGGENGYSCWLLFRPHEAKHFAIIPGGNRFLFLDGVMETLTEKPGSENGGHASNALRIRTFHLDGTRVRLVDDRTAGQ